MGRLALTAALLVCSTGRPCAQSEAAFEFENGPSIFPVASLAVRYNRWLDRGTYLRAYIADAVPGDPNRLEATVAKIDSKEGALLGAEIGWHGIATRDEDGAVDEESPWSKVALGVWGYTTGLGPSEREGGAGAYLLGQRELWRHEDGIRGLSAFARLGIAEEEVGPFDAYLGGGLVYHGLLPGERVDQLGLAVAAGRFGGRTRRAESPGLEPWEVSIELTWQVPVTEHLFVQPEVQWIMDPGGDPGLDDAWVLGMRGGVVF